MHCVISFTFSMNINLIHRGLIRPFGIMNLHCLKQGAYYLSSANPLHDHVLSRCAHPLQLHTHIHTHTHQQIPVYLNLNVLQYIHHDFFSEQVKCTIQFIFYVYFEVHRYSAPIISLFRFLWSLCSLQYCGKWVNQAQSNMRQEMNKKNTVSKIWQLL